MTGPGAYPRMKIEAKTKDFTSGISDRFAGLKTPKEKRPESIVLLEQLRNFWKGKSDPAVGLDVFIAQTKNLINGNRMF